MMTYLIISIVAWLSVLFPLWLSLKSRKKPIIRFIFWLTLLSFLFDLASYALGMQRVNTYPIGNAFLLVQTLLFLAMYSDAEMASPTILRTVAVTYLLLFLADFFFIQGPFIINSYSIVVGSIGFVVLSLLYFRKLLNDLPSTHVHRISMVWVNIAVLIYYGGNLFLFGLYNFFISEVWIVHNILGFAKNIFLFIAIWQSQRKINSISS